MDQQLGFYSLFVWTICAQISALPVIGHYASDLAHKKH